MGNASTRSESVTPGAPRRPLLALSIAGGGLLLSAAAFLLVRRGEADATQAEFGRLASDRAASLAQAIDADLALLRATEALFAGAPRVDRVELETFYRTTRADRRSPDVLAWAPRVPADGRAALEAELQAGGHPDFRIDARLPDGGRVPASSKPTTFPVTVAVPAEEVPGLLGVDLGSDPALVLAMEHALEEGQPRTSAPTRLSAGPGPAEACLVFHPVYEPGRSHASAEGRRRALTGFAVAVLRLSAIVERASDGREPEGIDLVLYDPAGDDPSVPVAVAPSPLRARADAAAFVEAAREGRIGLPAHRSTASVRMPGRTLRLSSLASPQFRAAEPAAQSWSVLLSCLVTTSLLAWFAFAGHRRESRVRTLVAERTAALSRAVEELRLEVDERTRAETTLAEQSARLDVTLRSIGDGVIVTDASGRVTFVNGAAEALTGWSSAEAAGRPLSEVFCALDETTREPIGDPVARTLATGSSWGAGEQAVLVARDGTERSVTGRAAPIGRQTGRFQGVVLVFHDVTERRRAVAALHRRQREQRTILDAVPALIWFMDADGRIVRANRLAAASAGLSVEEMEGKSAYDLYPEVAATRCREDLEVVRSGRPRLGRLESVTGPDRRVRWLMTDRVPYHDDEGAVAGVVVFAVDVTERVDAEEKLRESEELFRSISQGLPDGLFLIDFDDAARIAHASEAACRMHGYEAEELVGRPIADLDDPETAARVPERLERLRRGETITFEGVHLRKDGSTFPVEVIARTILHRGRRVVLAIDRDITVRRRTDEERRKLEAQVQHAQRLESLGVLAGGIAHDFNNLLMGILGNADLALQTLPSFSPARARVEDVRTAGVRASELTQQMLAYSGRGRFVIEPHDLNRLIKDMAHLLQVSISKRITVRYAFEDGLPAVEVDPAQVRQVVMNFLTNAGEAIGDRPGTVTVKTGRIQADAAYLAGTSPDPGLPEGEYVWIEVSDTGCGMDEATRARIFDPFFTTKFTGRGLGLAAVLGIMRGHKGAIRVTSAPGSGTTFRVLFPAARHRTARAEPERGEAPGRRLSGTVLVVDDDENVRTVVRRMLETCGVTVISTADGRSGVVAFRRRAAEIDAVLLDMTMPDLSGEEVLEEMRRVRTDTPVFLISGFTEQEAMPRFAPGDLAGFIQKPFTREELLSRLASVLAPVESLDVLADRAPDGELRDGA